MFYQITIKKIIQLFRAIALNNTEIATIRVGEDGTFNDANQDLYPQFYLEYPFSFSSVNLTNPTNHEFEQCSLSFLVVDRLSESITPSAQTFISIDEQIENCLTKCQILCNQILYSYKKQLQSLNIQLQSYNYITIHHVYSDKTYGIRCDLSFNFPAPMNFCEKWEKNTIDLKNIFNC